MASPHVAGVFALMKSVNPSLTPADNPRLTSSVNTLSFGGASTSLTLILRNGGKGDLALLGLSTSESWLQITATNVDPSGLGEYEVTVDRSNLHPGIYAAEITAQSSVNNLAVQVLASVGGVENSADLGVIYVLLIDPLTRETVAQRAITGNGVAYPFQFIDVQEGEYEISAGTDSDNDLFICDAGEACGAWLAVDQPIRIPVDADVSGLNFPVEYLVSLPTDSGAAATLRSESNNAQPRRKVDADAE